MLELTKRIERRSEVRVDAQLQLTYELRQRRWLRTCLVNGEGVQITLPRGERLRAGDLLVAADGRVVEVVAAPESIVEAHFATTEELIRAAYHLGNRHAATEICPQCLRLQRNPVLEAMLEKLGAHLIYTEACFEPEAGAYSGRHAHEGEAGAKIHEYGNGVNAKL